jgi:hypothetical protein
MTSTTRRTLESLSKLRLPELQARFAEIVGEPTRSPNKTFLVRRIGEVLEAREQQTNAEPTTPTTTMTGPAAKVKLTKLSVAELQAMYHLGLGVPGMEAEAGPEGPHPRRADRASRARRRRRREGPAAPHDRRRGRSPRRCVAAAGVQEPHGHDP